MGLPGTGRLDSSAGPAGAQPKALNTALGSDGQGPKGFSFVFLGRFSRFFFDFFDLF